MNSLDFCHCCGALRGIAASQARLVLSDLIQIQHHRPLQRGDGRLYEQSPQLSVQFSVQRNGGGLADREHICNDCLLVGVEQALKKLSALISVQRGTPSPWDPQHTLAHGRTVAPPPFPPAPPRSAPIKTAAAGLPTSADELARDLKHAIDSTTELRQQLTLMEEHARGEVWRWQVGGANDLASMGNRMGVLIYACDLRALLALVSPASYVSSAGIVASDMPGTVVRKLVAAFHKTTGMTATDAACQAQEGGA